MKRRSPAQVTAAEAVLLQHLQRRLIEDGFVETAHAVNEAMNKLGWEAVRLLEKAKK